jgi:hypothetical protein
MINALPVIVVSIFGAVAVFRSKGLEYARRQSNYRLAGTASTTALDGFGFVNGAPAQ